jgi:hypothetical protein
VWKSHASSAPTSDRPHRSSPVPARHDALAGAAGSGDQPVGISSPGTAAIRSPFPANRSSMVITRWRRSSCSIRLRSSRIWLSWARPMRLAQVRRIASRRVVSSSSDRVRTAMVSSSLRICSTVAPMLVRSPSQRPRSSLAARLADSERAVRSTNYLCRPIDFCDYRLELALGLAGAGP